MYEPARGNRPGCRETLILTRVAFGVLFPVLAAMIAILCLVIGMLYLLLTHPAFAVAPVALLVAGVWLFARWERGRSRPPDL